jgi:hypothetical protein
MRCHRCRTRPDAGLNRRSNSPRRRSTVPTIEFSEITCKPRSRSPARPNASTTGSNGSMTDTSSRLVRKRAAILSSDCRRRWRANTAAASDSGKPVLMEPKYAVA